jgi:hypothetical protein
MQRGNIKIRQAAERENAEHGQVRSEACRSSRCGHRGKATRKRANRWRLGVKGKVGMIHGVPAPAEGSPQRKMRDIKKPRREGVERVKCHGKRVDGRGCLRRRGRSSSLSTRARFLPLAISSSLGLVLGGGLLTSNTDRRRDQKVLRPSKLLPLPLISTVSSE